MKENQEAERAIKRSKFSEAQIVFVLKQVEDGTSIGEVCRKTGISEATFYAWRKEYAGLMPSEMRRLRQLEEENAKLKRLVAGLRLDKAMMQDEAECEARRRDCNECDRIAPSATSCRHRW